MKKIRKNIIAAILVSLFFLPAIGDAAALKQGMRGNDVAWLQAKLLELGFYNGSVDSVFGNATQSAVIAFQNSCGIESDGIVGEQTSRLLREYKNRAVPNRGNLQTRRGAEIVSYARQLYGTSYVWGGSSPGGFDCSGFITHVFSHFNVSLPRTADTQYYSGLSVPLNDLQAGDLVFFSTYEPGPSHVGIYLGNGQFIHASSAAGEVTITPLNKPYYQSRFLGAKRYL